MYRPAVWDHYDPIHYSLLCICYCPRDHRRDLFRPVYDWFTEGFDSADLKDAKALLDELAYIAPLQVTFSTASTTSWGRSDVWATGTLPFCHRM